ncbi:MAG: 2-oxoacid:acceptor oxidoreductase subunit alpha [Spirochaetes bacterium]|nr:MAG: 2-oxoacid:acceptor oxidoreductase subunit alpha [Spirochaetota bacterium]
MLFYRLYRDKEGRKVGFVQGNEACVEAGLIAGLRFFAGYPITPSSEIASVASAKLPMVGGKFIQMEDEISSMAAVIGASMTGIKAMTATSGPGFSLKQENIGFASLNEVPCVIVNVQRAGPSTGLPTQVSQGDVMQARWGTHGDHPIIVLSPSSVPEVVELTIRAFNLSEKYRNPVILLMDETVAHMREKIVLPLKSEVEIIDRSITTIDSSEEYKPFDDCTLVPPFSPFGGKLRYNITGLIHDPKGFPTAREDEVVPLMDRIHKKIEDNRDDIVEVKEHMTEDADILLVSFGISVKSSLGAMKMAREGGLKVGVLQLVTIWPFADREVDIVSQQVKRVFVVELNMGQIIREVERACRGRVPVEGINRYDGHLINPQEILSVIEERMK